MGTACCSPSISCKLPSALSQPLVYTCVYAHFWEVQWCVLGKIISKPGRSAELVMSPSVLTFSAELLIWVIIPQSLSAPVLLIFWMVMLPLFQAQHPWGTATRTYGGTYLCSSKVGGQAVLSLLSFLLNPYLFLKTESSKLLVTFPTQLQLFLRGQWQLVLQACGSLLGISSSSSSEWVWTDGSGPTLLPVNGWQLLQFLWCFREGRALPDSVFSLAACTLPGTAYGPWCFQRALSRRWLQVPRCHSRLVWSCWLAPAETPHSKVPWRAPKRAAHSQPKRHWSHQGIKNSEASLCPT